MLPPTAFREN